MRVYHGLQVIRQSTTVLYHTRRLSRTPRVITSLNSFFYNNRYVRTPRRANLNPILSNAIPLYRLPRHAPRHITKTIRKTIIPLLVRDVRNRNGMSHPLYHQKHAATLGTFQRFRRGASPRLQRLTKHVTSTTPRLYRFYPPLIIQRDLGPIRLLHHVRFSILYFRAVPPNSILK